MTKIVLGKGQTEGLEIELVRHAVCETIMGVAGFVEIQIAGHRVEIIASYDNSYAQDDDHPAGYVEHVKVDGAWLPEEEPECMVHLPFPIPGMHPEDLLSAEELFCNIAEHLGYSLPANDEESAERRTQTAYTETEATK